MKPITPMLAEIELRTIQDISTNEDRVLAEHKIPGMDGSVFQNLGRKPTKVALLGILYGEKAKEDLEKLRTKFKTGEPVSFVADITAATDVSQVLIEDLKVNEVAGKPDHFRYSVVLQECPPPPPPVTDILQQQALEAVEFLDNVGIGLKFAEQLSSYIPILKDSFSQISQGMKILFSSSQ